MTTKTTKNETKMCGRSLGVLFFVPRRLGVPAFGVWSLGVSMCSHGGCLYFPGPLPSSFSSPLSSSSSESCIARRRRLVLRFWICIAWCLEGFFFLSLSCASGVRDGGCGREYQGLGRRIYVPPYYLIRRRMATLARMDGRDWG